MKIRNSWKRAYKEGRLNDIPEIVRAEVVKQLEAGPKKEAFSQFTKQDFIELTEEIEVD